MKVIFGVNKWMCINFFLMFLISAQLIGGAKLIEVFWDINYAVGLLLFALLIFIYVFLVDLRQ